jgi:hypothetical protein
MGFVARLAVEACVSSPGRKVDLVSVQVRNGHVTLTPGFVLGSQDDGNATRPVLLMEEVDIVDFAADSGSIFLPIVLVQVDFTFVPTDPREKRLLATENCIIEILLETEHVAVVPNGLGTVLYG